MLDSRRCGRQTCADRPSTAILAVESVNSVSRQVEQAAAGFAEDELARACSSFCMLRVICWPQPVQTPSSAMARLSAPLLRTTRW